MATRVSVFLVLLVSIVLLITSCQQKVVDKISIENGHPSYYVTFIDGTVKISPKFDSKKEEHHIRVSEITVSGLGDGRCLIEMTEGCDHVFSSRRCFDFSFLFTMTPTYVVDHENEKNPLELRNNGDTQTFSNPHDAKCEYIMIHADDCEITSVKIEKLTTSK